MSLSLAKIVPAFLQHNAGQKFKAREIAEWVFANHPEACKAKLAASPALKGQTSLLLAQIVAEIGGSRPSWEKKHSQLKTTEGRPRLYYWSLKSDEVEVSEAEAEVVPTAAGTSASFKEADLYPLLAHYLWAENSLRSKRIDEKSSSNNRGPGGNRWLHPDVVGLEDLTSGLNNDTSKCAELAGAAKARLWSFEVKMLVNQSNVREAYFQAVSNSSWANFGWLVAAEVSGSETMRELNMLFSRHGIGLIRLDRDNPAESQVLIPARLQEQVDWLTCDRLARENKDFAKFIKLVRNFLQTGDHQPKEWDATPQD